MVDTRRAGLLLYGLHLAANLHKRASRLEMGNQNLPSSSETALQGTNNSIWRNQAAAE
jgi:hypothetical protein